MITTARTIVHRTNKNSANADIVREFTLLYDKGDMTIQKLVDAWYVAKDFGEIDMIECQMEKYKKECLSEKRVNES